MLGVNPKNPAVRVAVPERRLAAGRIDLVHEHAQPDRLSHLVARPREDRASAQIQIPRSHEEIPRLHSVDEACVVGLLELGLADGGLDFFLVRATPVED